MEAGTQGEGDIMFTLVRTLPSGEEKTQGPIVSVRDAVTFAGYVLVDNGLATKAQAQRFANRLGRMPIGHALTHVPSGYVFRIVSA